MRSTFSGSLFEPGAPPVNAFTGLMNFADLVRNGAPNVTLVPSFVEAVEP